MKLYLIELPVDPLLLLFPVFKISKLKW